MQRLCVAFPMACALMSSCYCNVCLMRLPCSSHGVDMCLVFLLPCCCGVFAIPLPWFCQSLSDVCAVSLQLQCFCRAFAMSWLFVAMDFRCGGCLPCFCHVFPRLLHVFGMSLQFCRHVIGMVWPCICRVFVLALPCLCQYLSCVVAMSLPSL